MGRGVRFGRVGWVHGGHSAAASEGVQNQSSDDFRALRDDAVPESSSSGSVQPSGNPMNHSHQVGLRLPPASAASPYGVSLLGPDFAPPAFE